MYVQLVNGSIAHVMDRQFSLSIRGSLQPCGAMQPVDVVRYGISCLGLAKAMQLRDTTCLASRLFTTQRSLCWHQLAAAANAFCSLVVIMCQLLDRASRQPLPCLGHAGSALVAGPRCVACVVAMSHGDSADDSVPLHVLVPH